MQNLRRLRINYLISVNEWKVIKITAKEHHEELLSMITIHQKHLPSADYERLQRYLGTNKKCYVIGAENCGNIVKEWIKQNPNMATLEFTALLDRLYDGESVEEIFIAGSLLRRLPQLRRALAPEIIDVWLNELHGWAEVDSLCQSCFTADEILHRWKTWKRLLTAFASDGNVQKKRASLVLLTRAVRESNERKLSDLAFANIQKLKSNGDILITKAISWLLRDLIKLHRNAVEDFVKNNPGTLPKIAIRETQIKLLTGKKTSRLKVTPK